MKVLFLVLALLATLSLFITPTSDVDEKATETPVALKKAPTAPTVPDEKPLAALLADPKPTTVEVTMKEPISVMCKTDAPKIVTITAPVAKKKSVNKPQSCPTR